MNKSDAAVSRRHVLAGAAGLIAAPMVLRPSRAAAKPDSVTITTTGGSFLDSMVKNVFSPFTEETGIKVNPVPAPDLAKIKAMLLTGNVQWDIYQNAGTNLASGSRQGFWEEVDSSIFDLEDLTVRPTGDSVTYQTYAAGIAWDPKRYGPGKHPTDFAEFFDLKKTPGRRALRKLPDGTLEAALLADGVKPKDIYPLDLDRAFNVLDRVKSSSVWADTTPQTVSLVQVGEADFSFTYGNRVKVTTAPGGGVPLAFSLDQNIIFTDGLAVLKGAPNKENALKLIAYTLRPEVQVRLEDQLGLMPVSKKAFPMLSAETRKWLPDMSNPNSLIVNNSYWSDNYEAVSRRFQEWLLS